MSEVFTKIKDFIGEVQDLFAKIGETNFIQTILGLLSKVFAITKEDEAKELIDAIGSEM